MGMIESKFIKRTTFLSFLFFLILTLTPAICSGIGLQDAEYISKISESNPYQSLVYALGAMCVVSVTALGYVYNQNINSVKEQYGILKSLSDNIATQNITIQKNQDILEKSIDVVNDKLGQKPCLLDSDILKDLLKK